MQLVEDDAEVNPTIPLSQLNYIRSLDDVHKQYTRFFDALLVPRPFHAAFFRDLKGFRSLPTTIKAFTLCDPNNVSISKEQRKENYRDVTRKYLGSRFAHPWCRKAMAGMGNTKAGGWWGAEWTATGRKMSKEQKEQEENLHKLLIPIWIGFRSKMFPSEAIIEEWWTTHQLESQLTKLQDLSGSSSTTQNENSTHPAKSVRNLRTAKSCSNIGTRQMYEDNNNDEDDDGSDESLSQQGATAATGLLRLAAAGMMINSMSKMQKWKLKREIKKQIR